MSHCPVLQDPHYPQCADRGLFPEDTPAGEMLPADGRSRGKTGTERGTVLTLTTGYNQSVTGCGSQRRQCSCYSTKTHENSMILILKLNLTSLRNTYIKSCLR